MTPDRRHDPDPHPPDGLPERRYCSDQECMKARQAWYEDTLLPKITLIFWRGVAATIIASCGALFFIVRALISDHSLEVEGLFVKQGAHREDITRIERKVDELEVHVTASMQEVIDRLDRNYQQIKDGPRR